MNARTPKLGVVLSMLGASALLLGCPLVDKLKKKGADAAIDDDDVDLSSLRDAATVQVTGSGAKNEDVVLRYAKEEPLAAEPASIAKDGTKVRTFPGNGAVVITLDKGAPVTKIAKYFSTGVLVTVVDPAGGTLMGWVSPNALAAAGAATSATGATPATPATPTTTGGGTALRRPSDAGTRETDASTAKGDAGSPKTDAGAAKADGGTAGVDAGAAKAASPKASDVVFPPDASRKCPSGFFLNGSVCRRTCLIDAACPSGTSCVKGVNTVLKFCTPK